MENVITLGKLIGCLFFLSPPPLSFVFENSENKRNDHARPVMGTIFLVIVGTSPTEKLEAQGEGAGESQVPERHFSLTRYETQDLSVCNNLNLCVIMTLMSSIM